MAFCKSPSALALCAALGGALGSTPATALPINLVTNGSFEANTIVPQNPGAPYQFIGDKTATPLSGWTTHSGFRGIILFNSGYQPVADGVNAVQLEWPGDTLSQTFATVAGQEYELSYAVSAFTDGGSNFQGYLNVAIDGATQTVNGSMAGYTNYSLAFVADNNFATLTFTSLGDMWRSYPQLDNVNVTAVANTAAVPEPASLALLALGLAGLGISRRNKV